MSELITDEKFTDGQQQIAASNMNGIISRAKVQPDIIANKPISATLDVADQVLVLKTDNTLARGRFDVLVNSVSSTLPLADATKNGTLRQVSGKTTDFVDGTNHCQSISAILPPGIMIDYAGSTAPTGWLLAQGQSLLRGDYPDLFVAIGTIYGSVDATHFTLPDTRGRVVIGDGHGTGLTDRILAATGGEEAHQLSIAELASHTHPVTFAPFTVQSGGGGANSITGGSSTSTGATGGNVAHNNMPPFLTTKKIIKT